MLVGFLFVNAFRTTDLTKHILQITPGMISGPSPGGILRRGYNRDTLDISNLIFINVIKSLIALIEFRNWVYFLPATLLENAKSGNNS